LRKLKLTPVEPKTVNQERLLRAIESHPVIISRGPAGVGKTFVAVHALLSLYTASSDYRKLVFIRPNVSTGPSLGAFPGTADEKLRNWLAPILTTVSEALDTKRVQTMISNGEILLQPVETIRGQSFEASLILVDEAQNLTKNEIIAVVTRLGEGSKLVISGDPDQVDRKDSGLDWLASFVTRHKLSSPVINFGIDDIVRSDFVGAFLRAMAKER
jgi:phosphate starvation-inducible PhoH-like protein